MKERPILFSGAMVRALLAGTKTQTRRIVKPQFAADAIPVEMPATDPAGGWVVPGHSGVWWCDAAANPDDVRRCPYGQPGDRLWVRESHWWFKDEPDHETGYYPPKLTIDDVHYRADGDDGRKVWRPSIHMPRWASRITLEVTGVRVERLQDISEADAMAEGAALKNSPAAFLTSYVRGFRDLWESINGPAAGPQNPWVWVVSFQPL